MATARLGSRRRRDWRRCAANAPGLGPRAPRPMRCGWCSLLLQAMGRMGPGPAAEARPNIAEACSRYTESAQTRESSDRFENITRTANSIGRSTPQSRGQIAGGEKSCPDARQKRLILHHRLPACIHNLPHPTGWKPMLHYRLEAYGTLAA
jgi:hypothetical protein